MQQPPKSPAGSDRASLAHTAGTNDASFVELGNLPPGTKLPGMNTSANGSFYTRPTIERPGDRMSTTSASTIERFSIFAGLIQLLNLVFFALFVDLPLASGTKSGGPWDYAVIFLASLLLVFVGYGLIFAFFNRYGWSGFGFAFVVAGLCAQWAILVVYFWDQVFVGEFTEITVEFSTLHIGLYGALAVLITAGVVLGKVSPTQLAVIGFLEVVFYGLTVAINNREIEAQDYGGAINVHIFGAYFGLGVSTMIGNPRSAKRAHPYAYKPQTSKTNGTFALLGAVVAFVTFPFFNAASGPVGNDAARFRIVVNTFFGLAASVGTGFCLSKQFSTITPHDRGRFEMQNLLLSVLAGGVALSSSASVIFQPWGAMVLGIAAVIVFYIGRRILEDLLKRCGVHDTMGLHALHGLCGLLGGIASAIAVAADFIETGEELPSLFPSMGCNAPGVECRTAGEQGGFQAAAMLVAVAMGVFGGFATGALVRGVAFDPQTTNHWIDDANFVVEGTERGDAEAEILFMGRDITELARQIDELAGREDEEAILIERAVEGEAK